MVLGGNKRYNFVLCSMLQRLSSAFLLSAKYVNTAPSVTATTTAAAEQLPSLNGFGPYMIRIRAARPAGKSFIDWKSTC